MRDSRQRHHVLRHIVDTALFEGGGIAVFTPDAIKLRHDPVNEDIQKRFRGLMTITSLSYIVDVIGRQRRIDAVQTHKGGSDRGRIVRKVRVFFYGFEFADWNTHPRIRAKAYRIVIGIKGAAEWGTFRCQFFQDLAKRLKLNFGVRSLPSASCQKAGSASGWSSS